MADNVQITAGSGTTIATDEVTDSVFGTAQVQFAKLLDGRDNGTNRSVIDAGGNLAVAPQATVSDTPSNYLDTSQQPLSMTTQGCLRVSSVPSDSDRIWQDTFSNPWSDNDGLAAWNMEDLY